VWLDQIAADGIEDCRKACGGHGYLLSSGLPELYCVFLQNNTVEGDNFLLTQQVGAYLLKSYIKFMTQGTLPENLAYLADAQNSSTEGLVSVAVGGAWADFSKALLTLYAARAYGRIARLAERMRVLTEDEGKSRTQAWNLVLVDIVVVSR